MTTQACVGVPPISSYLRVTRTAVTRLMSVAVLFGLFCALGPAVSAGQAQNYQTALGVPPFMAALPVENGSIDASTGNLHIEVPLGSFPQRGMPNLKVSLIYDSTIWTPAGGVWQPTNAPNLAVTGSAWGGWRLVTTADTGFNMVGEQWTFHTCTGGEYFESKYFTWTEVNGTLHYFPIDIIPHYNYCSEVDSGDAFATDSSGFHMFVTGGGDSITVYAADGTLVYSAPSGIIAPVKDTNGNYFYSTSDTLGRAALAGFTGTCASGATCYPTSSYNTCPSGATCFVVPNSTGGTSQFAVYSSSISMNTSFGQSGITECSTSCGMTVVTGVTMPDGTTYSFTYDQGTSAGNYGMLASMTLPTGAKVNYTYSNYTDSYGNVGRWITSRTNGIGSWSYAPTVISSCTSTSVGCEQQLLVTQPSTDQEVYTFELDNGAWPIQMQSYTGYKSAGLLLATQSTGWDFTHTCTTPTGCIGHSYITKLSDTTALPIPGNTLYRTTAYTYDTTTNDGNVTQVEEYKFYTGSLPSTPDRITNITYLTGSNYAAVNIMNRPASVTVTNGSGSTQFSQTNYAYDGSGGLVCVNSPGTCVTGVYNHDDTNYGTGNTTRGNLTQVQKWITNTPSATYLTSSMVYDTTGQVISVKDPASNITYLSYSDSFYNDASTPSSYHPSTPTNAYLTQVTQPPIGSNTFNSYFSYYYGTGQIALSTDVNGAVTTAHYLDQFSRPTSSSAMKGSTPLGWSLTAYTPATSTPTPMYVDSYTAVSDTSASTSCSGCVHSQIDFDSLGRPQYNKVMNNPDGVTTSQTSYDTNGRPDNVTAPNFSSGSITAADSTTYDGLNRPTSISHIDGSASYAYYGTKIIGNGGNGTQQCGPPTATCPYAYPVLSIDEAGKLHQTWTDGFGRLIEVDEPTATGGGGTAGQGTVTVGGSEQSTVVEIDPYCITMDCSGDCLAWSNGSRFGTPTYNTVYDYGTVSITVNSHTDSTSYGSGSTSSSIASALNTVINADSSASVTSTVSGSVLTLTAKTTGSSTNYTFSATSSTSDPTDFGSASFTTSYSSPMSGGASGGSGTPSLATPLVTTYVYDVVGNLLQVNQGVQTRTFAYDGLGRTTSASIPETTPTGGSQQTSNSYYDSNTTCSNSFPGQLVSTLDARGVRTCFQYDVLNRLTQKSYIVVSGVPSTSTVSYSYDSGGASANALGRLTSMTDGVGSETYTYDAGGRVTQLAKVINSNTYTTSYTYNVAGEPLSIAYPSGHTAYSAYDPIGRLCAVGGTSNSCTSNSTPYATMPTSNAYNAANQLLKFTYGNSVLANLGYSNNRLQMTSLAYTNSASTLLLGLNYYYTYNSPNCTTGTTGNNGQIQCIGDATSTAAAGRSAAYTYDELGRLSSAATTGSTGTGGYAQWGLSFSYDRYGNLLKEQSSGAANTTCLAVSTSTNQVTGTCALPSLSTYSYDANGNMLGEGENALTYDAENRTTNAAQSGSSVADYVYDGNGLRVKKCTPSCSASSPTITAYIFSGSNVIAEYTVASGTPALAREYLYAGGLKLATVVATVPTYHLRDHLSVRVNTDSSGATIGEQGHYPFGDDWYMNSTTTKEMFTTYERDPETGSGTTSTGNDYAMARYNVNRLGRFSSIDRLSGSTGNPQSLNHYAYSLNDPINGSDPTGLSDTKANPVAGDKCADSYYTSGNVCMGGGDGLTGEGGSDAWGQGWWNAVWGWTQWSEGTADSGGGFFSGSGGAGFGLAFASDPDRLPPDYQVHITIDVYASIPAPLNTTSICIAITCNYTISYTMPGMTSANGGGSGNTIGPSRPTKLTQPCRIVDPFFGSLEFSGKAGIGGKIANVGFDATMYHNLTSGEQGQQVSASYYVGEVHAKHATPCTGGYVCYADSGLETGGGISPSHLFNLFDATFIVGFEVSVNLDTFNRIAVQNQACKAAGGS